MTKGLENILEKIIENPRQTLIGRYLSLIADIADEDERAGYALDLAETLAKSKPNDALKIAYMIYGSGRHLTRALKVVIECFETKGRPGKVAVLQLELEKLTRDLNSGVRQSPLPLPDLKTGKGSEPSHFSFNELSSAKDTGQKAQDTRMAELDLGDLQEEDYTGAHTVDFLFNYKDAEKLADEPEPVKADNIAEGFFAGFSGRPGDTVLPVMPNKIDSAFIKGSGTAVSVVGAPIRKVNTPQESRLDSPIENSPDGVSPVLTTDDSSVAPPALSKVPQPFVDNPPVAASEIFDRLFADRKYQEAEAVLYRADSEQMFEWWRVRYERLKDIATADYKLTADQFFHANEGEPGKSESTPKIFDLNDCSEQSDEQLIEPFSGDFRSGIVTEILALSSRYIETPVKLQTQKIGNLRIASKLPAELLDKISSLPVDTVESEMLFFDLIQGLFASLDGETLLELLEKKDLSKRSPVWFGIYLDALLRCGFSRKLIVEGLLQAEKQPKLVWIRVIWRRLPAAWDSLGVKGFSWSEDDGVKDFIRKINVRGQQRIWTFLDTLKAV